MVALDPGCEVVRAHGRAGEVVTERECRVMKLRERVSITQAKTTRVREHDGV